MPDIAVARRGVRLQLQLPNLPGFTPEFTSRSVCICLAYTVCAITSWRARAPCSFAAAQIGPRLTCVDGGGGGDSRRCRSPAAGGAAGSRRGKLAGLQAHRSAPLHEKKQPRRPTPLRRSLHKTAGSGGHLRRVSCCLTHPARCCQVQVVQAVRCCGAPTQPTHPTRNPCCAAPPPCSCGSSFEVGVISAQFEGKMLIARHRMASARDRAHTAQAACCAACGWCCRACSRACPPLSRPGGRSEAACARPCPPPAGA